MKQHLYLIGMMGCGKSTMAHNLSALTGAAELDLDAEIARFENRSIPEIFADGGDAGFRVVETAALRRAAACSPRIIATGGGIVTREENIRIMRETGLVIWLNRPLESMIADVRQDTRPNLAGDKEERMRTLFTQREALYRRAAHVEFLNDDAPMRAAQALSLLPQVLDIL